MRFSGDRSLVGHSRKIHARPIVRQAADVATEYPSRYTSIVFAKGFAKTGSSKRTEAAFHPSEFSKASFAYYHAQSSLF
ncbi:hypothetical protein HZH66_005932 [Vespula vulgaris]|uniref:Uncharacterized protein n=1 Tax=Vespula vulgaris TaxID=7454 RepID=A0A834K5S4_VESVU|nr:hypothetical protein HZH66_005932 [Vespula vulgaris]